MADLPTLIVEDLPAAGEEHLGSLSGETTRDRRTETRPAPVTKAARPLRDSRDQLASATRLTALRLSLTPLVMSWFIMKAGTFHLRSTSILRLSSVPAPTGVRT